MQDNPRPSGTLACTLRSNAISSLMQPVLLALVAAMVFCLALMSQQMLSFLVTSPDRAPAVFTIVVRESAPSVPPKNSPVLRFDDLLVDGRRLRFESTERSSHWTTKPIRGSNLPSNLIHDGGTEPATLTFSGSSFVIAAKARAWSGVIEVRRDDHLMQTIDVQTPDFWRERALTVEGPAAPPSMAVLAGALTLFSVAAWTIAPWRGERRAEVWLILFLVAFHGMFWSTHPVGTTGDSRAYVETLAINMAGHPATFPPGYPAFLGIIEILSPTDFGRSIALFQHILTIVAAFWVYLLARRLFSVELSLVASILAGTLAPIDTMCQMVMSEAPTVFAMVGALYFGLRAAETGRVGLAAAAGVLAGWSGTLRVIPIGALLPAIVILLVFSSAPRRVHLMSVAVGAAVGVVLTPVLWFTFNSGKPALSTSVGQHLYERVVYQQKLLDESGPATQRLTKILDGEDPRQYHSWAMPDRPGFKELSPEFSHVDQLYLRVAREAFQKDPLVCLSYTFSLAWRIFFSDASSTVPSCGDTKTLDAELESPPPLQLTASALRTQWFFERFQRLAWPVLCGAAIIGAVLGLRASQLPSLVLATASVPILYLLAQASSEVFLQRYNVPTIPFVVLLAILPLSFLEKRIRAPRARIPESKKPEDQPSLDRPPMDCCPTCGRPFVTVG